MKYEEDLQLVLGLHIFGELELDKKLELAELAALATLYRYAVA